MGLVVCPFNGSAQEKRMNSSMSSRPDSALGDEETDSEEEDDTILYSTVDLCVTV